MKRVIKTGLVLTLALLFIFNLAGCGSKTEQTVEQTAEVTEAATNNETTEETKTNTETEAKDIELTMYYPVAVGGPLTEKIQKICDDFHAQNPTITVNPVYCGSYAETTTKAQTAVQGNNPPDLAVMFSIDLHAFKDLDAIQSLDAFIAEEEAGFIDDYFPAFMENAIADDQVWGVPFQRSTIVLYYNKDLFKAAGLDPEKAPENWDELVEYGKKLTKEDGSQWGVEIPSTGYQYWMFQALALQSGGNLMNSAGDEAYINNEGNIEAIQFWKDLGSEHKVMPEGIIEWKAVPTDFLEGKTAMMYHSTGNLSNVKKNASFDFGVAMLPANKTFGSPTGGGNLYIFKNTPEENQKAAWEFMKYATSPEVAAQWCIDTGYVGVTKLAWETNLLTEYVAGFPEAEVAKNQLEYAAAELSTHDNPQMTKNVNDIVQAALVGDMSVEAALEEGQKVADELLKAYK